MRFSSFGFIELDLELNVSVVKGEYLQATVLSIAASPPHRFLLYYHSKRKKKDLPAERLSIGLTSVRLP
jgi:hypothetical protein